MYSDSDTACAVGCPIRKSRDQRLLASPPGLSQRATSFIASQCQGIHQMPFVSRLSTTPNGKYQNCITAEPNAEDAANFSLEDTCWTRPSRPSSEPRSPVAGVPDVSSSVTSLLAIHRFNQQTATRAGGSTSRIGTSCRVHKMPFTLRHQDGGGERDRTDDLLLAKQALSQLSYTPGSGRHFCHLNGGPGRI